MTQDRAWVLLPSGRRLDLLGPDPSAWTERDLAVSLSRTYAGADIRGETYRFPSRSTACSCSSCASRCSHSRR